MKRGDVCGLRKDTEIGYFTIKQRKIYNYLKSKKTARFWVMKVTDEGSVILAPMYICREKDSEKVFLNKRSYWVRFSEFLLVPKSFVNEVPDYQLEDSYQTVTRIYKRHNAYLEKRKKQRAKENERRQWEQIIEEGRERRSLQESREPVEVPEYLARNAARPFLGGCFTLN